MGDGTAKNPYTREDVLRLIEENGGKAEGLDLSGKVFEKGIDLSKQSLFGITLKNAWLIQVNLSESELGNAHFEGASLIGANLKEANICETHFESANLKEANCKYAFSSRPHITGDLSGITYFNGTNLEGADLEGTFLECARFVEADLAEAHFERAKLAGAYFQRARLICSHLEGANLMNAHLEGAELRSAFLEGAYLFNAQLMEADLRGAHLKNSFLINANLKEAELGHAHLDGADLRDAKLEGVDLVGVEISRDTKLDNVYWGNYILYRENCGEFHSVIPTYRHLKIWYIEHGMNDIAAKFYYREMEARRKEAEWSWNPNVVRHRLALEALRALFGYGEHWERVFYWMALVVFGSAAAYYLSGELNLLYSLYFSVISFTALGYGKWVDIVPQGWVQALGAFQSFAGVFLMALLLVTFFRKWTR